MRLRMLEIRNLRGIRQACIHLHPRLTVIVGANNSGKTTILDAIEALLTWRRGIVPFSERDFHSDGSTNEPASAAPIFIAATICPSIGTPRFPSGDLPEGINAEVEGVNEFVKIGLTVKFDADPAIRSMTASLSQLFSDGRSGQNLRAFPFRDEFPFRAFGTDRDFRRGTAGRWSDWGRLIAALDINPSQLSSAVEWLRQSNDAIRSGTPSIEQIEDGLRHAAVTVGMPGKVSVNFSSTTPSPSELLRALSVELQPHGSTRSFEADRHGLGTQGALLFSMYQLVVERIICAAQDDVCPVLTVEEIEAHLHPTAQRAIAVRVAALPGQTIATTHSPEIVRSLAAENVVLLRSDSKAGCIASSVSTAERIFFDNARALFARCLIIAEGYEDSMLAVFGKAMLGPHDSLASLGVEIINAQGQGHGLPLWQNFGRSGFQIPIVLVGDADTPSHIRTVLNIGQRLGYLASIPEDDAMDSRHIEALRACNYYTPPPGLNVEQVLATEVPDAVDAALTDLGDDTHSEWRSPAANNRLSDKDSRRFGGARCVRDLNDQQARTWRIANRKSSVYQIAVRITEGGTNADRIPEYFRSAIVRSSELARGQT